MSVEKDKSSGGLAEALQDFGAEFSRHWRDLPNKGLFFGLLVLFLALFQFVGSSTFGYIDTPSLFHWMFNAYNSKLADDNHGLLMPFVVLVLFWWKRDELMKAVHTTWWPGLLLLVVGLALHLVGYLTQQARLSIMGLFTGIYGLMGLAWGPQWLKACFFPYFLFAFCIPLGSLTESVSFPLRLLVTKIVTLFSQAVLGIDVGRAGTQLYNPEGNYQYEIAAACSGIRSLMATVAIALIYGFLSFRSWWKRLALVASAVPLAVLGNVVRMLTIVIAAELGGKESGQAWGSFVHENALISLLPYVPAIAGLMFLGRWLGEEPGPAAREAKPEAAS